MKPIGIMKLSRRKDVALTHFLGQVYAGTGAAQTVSAAGLNLVDKGALLWEKPMNSDGAYHSFIDTVRGRTKWLLPTDGAAEGTDENYIMDIRNGAYDVKDNWSSGVNVSSSLFVREPDAFDIVSYAGNSTANRSLASALTNPVGLALVKNRTTAGNWTVYHQSMAAGQSLVLNSDAAAVSNVGLTFSGTNLVLGTNALVNATGQNYIAYLFGHSTNDDSRSVAGSYTGTGAAQTITLPFTPRFVLIKKTNGTGNWYVVTQGTQASGQGILMNTLGVSVASSGYAAPTTNGIQLGTNANVNSNGDTFIYLAVR